MSERRPLTFEIVDDGTMIWIHCDEIDCAALAAGIVPEPVRRMAHFCADEMLLDSLKKNAAKPVRKRA